MRSRLPVLRPRESGFTEIDDRIAAGFLEDRIEAFPSGSQPAKNSYGISEPTNPGCRCPPNSIFSDLPFSPLCIAMGALL